MPLIYTCNIILLKIALLKSGQHFYTIFFNVIYRKFKVELCPEKYFGFYYGVHKLTTLRSGTCILNI